MTVFPGEEPNPDGCSFRPETSSLHKVYRCSSCPWFSQKKKNYLQHCQSHRPRPKAKHKCALCTFSTTKRNYLSRHAAIHSKPPIPQFYLPASASADEGQERRNSTELDSGETRDPSHDNHYQDAGMPAKNAPTADMKPPPQSSGMAGANRCNRIIARGKRNRRRQAGRQGGLSQRTRDAQQNKQSKNAWVGTLNKSRQINRGEKRKRTQRVHHTLATGNSRRADSLKMGKLHPVKATSSVRKFDRGGDPWKLLRSVPGQKEDQPEWYKCRFCPCVCSRRNLVAAHEALHRRRRDASDSGLLKCGQCSFRVRTARALSQHKIVHSHAYSPQAKTAARDSVGLDVSGAAPVTAAAAAEVGDADAGCGSDADAADADPGRLVNLGKGTGHKDAPTGATDSADSATACQRESQPEVTRALPEQIFASSSHTGSSGDCCVAKQMNNCTEQQPRKLRRKTRLRRTAKVRQVDQPLEINRMKKYACEKCPYATAKRMHFQRHSELHGSRQRFTCDFCDYSVPSGNLLTQHRKIHMMPNQNLLALQSPGNLRLLGELHRTQQGAGHVTAGCLPPVSELCLGAFRQSCQEDGPSLERNLSLSFSLPPSPAPPPSPCPLFFCDRCPFRSNQRSTLLGHFRHHQGSGDCACPYCDFRASTADLVCAHVEVHFCTSTQMAAWQEGCDLDDMWNVMKDDLQALIAASPGQQQEMEELGPDPRQGTCADADTCGSVSEDPSVQNGTDGQTYVTRFRRPRRLQTARHMDVVTAGAKSTDQPGALRCHYCDIPLEDSSHLASHHELHMLGNYFQGPFRFLPHTAECTAAPEPDSETLSLLMQAAYRNTSGTQDRPPVGRGQDHHHHHHHHYHYHHHYHHQQ